MSYTKRREKSTNGDYFCSLFYIFPAKNIKRHILNSVWSEQNPYAGQNIQQTYYYWKGAQSIKWERYVCNAGITQS